MTQIIFHYYVHTHHVVHNLSLSSCRSVIRVIYKTKTETCQQTFVAYYRKQSKSLVPFSLVVARLNIISKYFIGGRRKKNHFQNRKQYYTDCTAVIENRSFCAQIVLFFSPARATVTGDLIGAYSSTRVKAC